MMAFEEELCDKLENWIYEQHLAKVNKQRDSNTVPLQF